MFLGERSGAYDTNNGRRGGGGGLFVELIAEPGGASAGASQAAAEIAWSYLAASTGEHVTGSLATRAAIQLYHAGDCARALGVIDMMAPSIGAWQTRYGDPDIRADEDLLLQLRTNIDQQCTATQPITPRDFSGGCMYS